MRLFPLAAIDIETDGALNLKQLRQRKDLHAANVILIGLLIAQSRNRVRYSGFSSNDADLGKLRDILTEFPGTILSFNGLKFDFIALEKKLPIKQFFSKFFDIFHWVQKKVGRRKGTRLEDFARANLGIGKLGSWKEGFAAWKKGDKKKLTAYNRRDCELTLKLYLKMVHDGHLRLEEESLLFLKADHKIPQVGYRTWISSQPFRKTRSIANAWFESDNDGDFWEVMLEAMGHEPNEIARYGAESLLAQYSGTGYVRCKCGKYFSYTWTEWPGFRDVQDFNCPACGRKLGRADLNGMVEISSVDYLLQGEKKCPRHRIRLKFRNHRVYHKEAWDVYWCPKCRKEYTIDTT
ncbi:MAG: ribonuclease H-like domain-containing protein [Elusimicrobia bacterium]|nr:ribonuclease H-like domain-containing protein [Elusimicrobiota bacterium]